MILASVVSGSGTSRGRQSFWQGSLQAPGVSLHPRAVSLLERMCAMLPDAKVQLPAWFPFDAAAECVLMRGLIRGNTQEHVAVDETPDEIKAAEYPE